MKSVPSKQEQVIDKQSTLFSDARMYAKTPAEITAAIVKDMPGLLVSETKLVTEILKQNEPYRSLGLEAIKPAAKYDHKIYIKNLGDTQIFKFSTKVIGKNRHNGDILADDLHMVDKDEVFYVELKIGIYLLFQYGKDVPGNSVKSRRPMVEVTELEYLEYLASLNPIAADTAIDESTKVEKNVRRRKAVS